jgi:hypothetical protein
MRLEQYITEGNMAATTTKDETGHIHSAIINVDGDGKTVSTKSKEAEEHEHKIFQWSVQPANGHVHNIED